MADTKITALTEETAPVSADLVAIVDDPAGTPATEKCTRENFTKVYNTHPIVMEVPQDTVAYPDVFALGDASAKITGFWLPNSGTSIINWKCIVPQDLHTTAAAKVAIYMLPRTTVANSTVNLTLSRLYVNTTEDVDAALSAESAVDVELTSTADFLTIYEYDVSAEPTEGELIVGTLTRTPGAANDDFTEDLLIVGMELRIYTVAA